MYNIPKCIYPSPDAKFKDWGRTSNDEDYTSAGWHIS